MQVNQLEINQLVLFLNIFRNKKIKYDNQWLFQADFLTDTNIENHLNGLDLYGYFLTHSTDIFGIDIDLHGNYLNNEIKINELLDKYNFIIDKLGKPTIVFRSSHTGGLHCYWKIDRKIFHPIIQNQILQTLQITEIELNKKGIDLLPKPNKAICLPYAKARDGDILNPETLQPLFLVCNAEKLIDFIKELEPIKYETLFNAPPGIINIWLKHSNKNKQYKEYTRLARCNKYESEILPFKQGETNDKIEKLCFNYAVNGITESEAFIKIDHYLNESKIIRDKDIQQKHLDVKIKCHYKRIKKDYDKILSSKVNQLESKDSIDLFMESIIDKRIIELCIYMYPHMTINSEKDSCKSEWRLNNAMSKKITMYKRFLIRLYKWTRYIESIDNDTRQILTYKYNFFYYYTKTKGLIPLPCNLLRKWNDRYNELLPALINTGIISLEKKYYNPYKDKTNNEVVKGICNYYKVNI